MRVTIKNLTHLNYFIYEVNKTKVLPTHVSNYF